MRYQELIYIQNEHSGVRNKDILNVNMSSDMCIFRAPEFEISGASKIDCSCSCTPDYTLLEGGICQFVEITGATINGTILTAYTGSVSTGYDNLGTKFFNQELTGVLPYTLTNAGVLIDGNLTTISEDILVNTGNLWDSNGSSSNGRLNNTGIWATAGAPLSNEPVGSWIGFSKCIELPTSGTYSVGLAADNLTRFKINGELFYTVTGSTSTAFQYWSIFEITLSAGTNVIEMEGYNISGQASFGAEIYQSTISNLTGLTTTSDLDRFTIFTTKDFRYETNGNFPVEFQLGDLSGYSCPSGYFLNTCGTGFTCSILIESGCTIPTGEYYVINDETTIPFDFNFTGNVETFSANNATFNYEVYKFNANSQTFTLPPIYKSENFEYSGFSSTSAITQNIPVNSLGLDGQYLIKGYYKFNACTNFLNKLGKTVNTLSFIKGKEYDLYDEDLDFYFTAFKGADKPIILNNGTNSPSANKLFQQTILPEDNQTNIIITNSYDGYFILTSNGIVLTPTLDFTFTGNVVTLITPATSGDVITVSYTTLGGETRLMGDNIYITSPIVSGVTGNQGSGSTYFNTDEGKYEIYTSITPEDGGDILVMINGVVLATGIDFYQSISDSKRIILVGDLLIGDEIAIVYFPITNTVNGLLTNRPTISWEIETEPQLVNGLFTLEVSTGNTFTTLYSGMTQPYVVGQTGYYDRFIAQGEIGTILYYRVKNEKNYINLCGSVMNDIKYSDIIPITIQTNSINSY